jgi:hypothetical protein
MQPYFRFIYLCGHKFLHFHFNLLKFRGQAFFGDIYISIWKTYRTMIFFDNESQYTGISILLPSPRNKCEIFYDFQWIFLYLKSFKCWAIGYVNDLDFLWIHIQWNFSKPDPQKTGSPWISANLFSPCGTSLCKRNLAKPATPLNQPYFSVPVLAGLEKFHCITIWKQKQRKCTIILKYTYMNSVLQSLILTNYTNELALVWRMPDPTSGTLH